MPKIERKYLAHYLDSSFNGAKPAYVRLGADLEEYIEELGPDVEVKKNILGEQNVTHNGYEVQSEVDPFYADFDDPLFEVERCTIFGGSFNYWDGLKKELPIWVALSSQSNLQF